MKSFPLRHRFIGWMQNIDLRGVRFLASKLPEVLMPSPKGPMVLKTRHGIAMHIDPVSDPGVERSLYYTGSYEPGTLSVMDEVLSPGGRFVDVGANIGLMALYAAQCVGSSGSVVAFEPHPKTRDILIKNLKLNPADQVEVVPLAAGSEPGKAVIYDRGKAERGSSSLLASTAHDRGHPVEVVRLDDFFADRKGDVDMVKIDVEGYETEVLRGMKKLLAEQRPVLVVESSMGRANEGGGPGEIFDCVYALGYTVFRLKGGKERKSNLIEVPTRADMPTHDNVFCFPK